MIEILVIINFLRNKGLLYNFLYCEGCSNLLNEVKYEGGIDKIVFGCYKSGCINKNKHISILKNSFFMISIYPLMLYRNFDIRGSIIEFN